jgi:hypothetical protein
MNELIDDREQCFDLVRLGLLRVFARLVVVIIDHHAVLSHQDPKLLICKLGTCKGAFLIERTPTASPSQ